MASERTVIGGSRQTALSQRLTESKKNNYGVALTWRDLSVYVMKKKTRVFLSSSQTYTRIINNVTGAVLPGSLVALIGGSGAGKSTLLAALAHRSPAGTIVDGEVRMDGLALDDSVRQLTGFLHQHEAFFSSLTVREHLSIMAHLKMDRGVPRDMRELRVQSLLKALGLAHRADTLIGEPGARKVLSGGERKRLAFATELLTDPEMLFCDEPTTGLDSVSAQTLVEVMRDMAAHGKTILCSIHQPSSEIFEMFDNIILLADGGRIAFMGTVAAGLEFFGRLGFRCPPTFNPADFLVRTLAVTPGQEEDCRLNIRRLCDHFAVSEAAQDVDVLVRVSATSDLVVEPARRINMFKPASWATKLRLLTWRAWLQVFRDPTLQWIRIGQKVAIALMAGLCYLGTDALTQRGIQAVQGALFLLVSENVFSPMYAAISAFHAEMPLFRREHAGGLYSTLHYYLAKVFAELPGQVLEPVLFVVVAYWLVGLRNTVYAFTMTALIAVLTQNVSTACGWFFAAAFESVSIAMTYLVPFDYVLMITSGVFIKLGSIPMLVGWMKYLSWLMYSNEAFSIIQWQGITNITCELPAGAMGAGCATDGAEVLSQYSFAEGHFLYDIGIMLALFFIFHLLAYACLRARANTK
ncbi:protein scarlet-like isoform X1 [Schistocerca cancellata]|uniref:protein scarlet-like isoform X1 n=2 Tax=Schistocerca cancellata TaxID=274614 RepID=UPI002118D1C3|nr:protein scarlet-like isoform X1 [Schistocerca cancellata]